MVSTLTAINEPVSEDFEAIQRAQSDPEHFRPLYEKYFKEIFRFVLKRVEDRDTAADITSQVFLKALTNLKKFENKGVPFSAWLYRIAINECTDLFRRRKQHRLVSVDEQSLSELHEELTREDTVLKLQSDLPVILESLSPEDLNLIELRFFEQLSFKEVAQILGLTETNAKVKTYRILDRMRKLFLKLRRDEIKD